MKGKFYRSPTVVLIALTAAFWVFGSGACVAAAQQRVGTLFSGEIGDAKIEMDIRRDGGSLTGSYYYLRSGSASRLKLKGTIAADGTFTMRETDAAGKQTGEFKGKWIEAEADKTGALLSGDWFKPGQTSGGLGFYANEQMLYFETTQITIRESKESTKDITLSGQYPELRGNAGAAGFNQLAKAHVMASLADLKKREIAETNDIECSVEYADDNLISVKFVEYTSSGSARPESYNFTITYDLKAGRELKLADLFKPGSQYLTRIAEYCLKDLKARNDEAIAHGEFEAGAEPTADNYSNWNITPKGLMITFNSYQVAPDVYGSLQVIVPYSQLKDIARADGPLGKVKGTK